MVLSLIAAMDENNVIGKNNDLPWKLPRELQYVKKVTQGCPIIMGRKNFDSIGRPLPGRRNIIITRDKDYKQSGCEIVHSVEEAMKICREERETFVFGGAEIYRLFLPLVEKMYLTKIHYVFEGDTYFPEVDFSLWEEVSKVKGIKDENNIYDYTMMVYEKR